MGAPKVGGVKLWLGVPKDGVGGAMGGLSGASRVWGMSSVLPIVWADAMSQANMNHDAKTRTASDCTASKDDPSSQQQLSSGAKGRGIIR